ncbi:MAG: hypothetical protein AAF492_31445, partial [Verrucomicrobiota bacterium]
MVFFAVAVFLVVTLPGQTLFTTDDNIGAITARKAALPSVMWDSWKSSPLLGYPVVVPMNWTNTLISILSPEAFTDWVHAIDLTLASIFFALFLRLRGVRWGAVVLGVLAGFWFGANFTLTYAGHIGKFGLLMFASGYLWMVECMVR